MRILVTGANGFIATALLQQLSLLTGHTLNACGRTKPRKGLSLPNVIYKELDITCKQDTIAYCRSTGADVIIHTAAISNVDACETKPGICQMVNVEATATLCEAAKTLGAYLLFLSTDHVFDGRHGHYNEGAHTGPLNKYGSSKLAGEQLIINAGIAYGIARTSLVFGRSHGQRKNFVEFVSERLGSGEAISLARDQVRSPTLVTDLCGGLVQMSKEKTAGIFHLAGKEPISVYETGLLIADLLSLEKKLILPVNTKDLQHAAARPLNTSLDCEKARIELGYQSTSLQNGLKQVFAI